MPEIHTLPTATAGMPVRAVKVVVERGPDAGKSVTAQRESISIGTAHGNDLELTDPRVSRYHLELTALGDRIRVADKGSTNGTKIDAVMLRAGAVTVPPDTAITIGETTLRIVDGGVIVLPLHKHESIANLVGRSPAIRQVMAQLARLAEVDAPVLVLGESGTGKELVARALHELGPRREAAMVTVDCAVLSPALVASELFGHERGAFTGADRAHVGAFERAHKGTLFLDELGELPESMQSALLGALERRRFRRVGGTKEIDVDVRVIAATNSDLRARVNAGTFRLDLYYRVAVALLELPPLRERAGDVRLLIEHFLREAGATVPIDRVFDDATIAALERHVWPGNVRELRNVVLRALATGEAHPDALDRKAALPGADAIAPLLALPYKDARRTLLDEFELRYLQSLLAKTGGNVRQAARDAAMDRTYLTELLKRHGLV